MDASKVRVVNAQCRPKRTTKPSWTKQVSVFCFLLAPVRQAWLLLLNPDWTLETGNSTPQTPSTCACTHSYHSPVPPASATHHDSPQPRTHARTHTHTLTSN